MAGRASERASARSTESRLLGTGRACAARRPAAAEPVLRPCEQKPMNPVQVRRAPVEQQQQHQAAIRADQNKRSLDFGAKKKLSTLIHSSRSIKIQNSPAYHPFCFSPEQLEPMLLRPGDQVRCQPEVGPHARLEGACELRPSRARQLPIPSSSVRSLTLSLARQLVGSSAHLRAASPGWGPRGPRVSNLLRPRWPLNSAGQARRA